MFNMTSTIFVLLSISFQILAVIYDRNEQKNKYVLYAILMVLYAIFFK